MNRLRHFLIRVDVLDAEGVRCTADVDLHHLVSSDREHGTVMSVRAVADFQRLHDLELSTRARDGNQANPVPTALP